MSGERFTLDTNILVYSVDVLAGERHALAVEMLKVCLRRDCCLTLQAVSEFYVVVTRKGLMPRLDAAAQANDMLSAYPTVAASGSAVRTALAVATAGRASYWDALLIATAAEAGCASVVTEDLAEGAKLDGVRIVHPFDGANLSIPAQRLLGQ